MKRIILLGFLITTLTAGAQDFYSTGDCKASFKFEVNPNIYTLLPATAINFYDTSEGIVKAWYWDCGDTITSTEQNPMFIFNHPIGGPTVKISPYRTISLTIVTDSCKSTFSQLINIIDGTLYEQQSCQAHFKFYETARDSTEGTVTFKFVNESTGNNLIYFWQFGDLATSTEMEPELKLNMKQADFKVCLTVTGTDSCVSSFWETVIVSSPVPEPACQALFNYYESGRDTVGGTAKIVFNNYSGGTDLQYFWQFGDMETSTEREPVHIFSLDQPEYKVCLTVTGADGCSSTECQPVYTEYPIVTDTVQPGCFVDFGYERKDILMSPLPSVVIDFYYESFSEATEWYWDFGDGTTSNEPNPTHVYIKPFMNDSMKVMYNPYRTVCLTIKTADECKINSCQTIQIFDYNPEPEKCQVYFEYQPADIVSIPEVVPIKLVEVSQGDVISRLWQFEDGTTSTEKDPLISFNIFQSVHKVCLTVTFADSCINTFCNAVYVNGGYVDTVVVDTVSPINWWRYSGEREKLYIRSDAGDGMKVEWRLCNGTIVEADSIPLDDINCGGNQSNMIVKDSLGNIVYSETIALKGSVTGIEDLKTETKIKLWPNPVSSKLNIRYSGIYQSVINIEICDIMGKRVSTEMYSNISDGQEFNIVTETLRTGIYICRITSAGKTIASEKFSRQ